MLNNWCHTVSFARFVYEFKIKVSFNCDSDMNIYCQQCKKNKRKQKKHKLIIKLISNKYMCFNRLCIFTDFSPIFDNFHYRNNFSLPFLCAGKHFVNLHSLLTLAIWICISATPLPPPLSLSLQWLSKSSCDTFINKHATCNTRRVTFSLQIMPWKLRLHLAF